jgi:hypothetical protein
MHGQVNGVTAQGLQGYSQVAATKTSEAAAAAATRRKLLRIAEELGGEVDVETAEMVREWKGGKKDKGGVVIAGTYRWICGVMERGVEVSGERVVSYWV